MILAFYATFRARNVQAVGDLKSSSYEQLNRSLRNVSYLLPKHLFALRQSQLSHPSNLSKLLQPFRIFLQSSDHVKCLISRVYKPEGASREHETLVSFNHRCPVLSHAPLRS